MAKYRIEIRERAEADFLTIPFPFRRQLNQRLRKLRTDPRSEDAEAVGESERYRLDVAGWRILYEVDDAERVVRIVSFRKLEDPKN